MLDMIVFGEDWGRHPSSTQHLMNRLADDANIIWVNSLGLRRPRLNRADIARLGNKLLARRTQMPTAGSGEHTEMRFKALINPKTLPLPGSRLAGLFNRFTLTRQIRPVMRSNRITKPIVWTSLPTAYPAVGAFGERALVYYAGDDFGALAGVDHAPVLELEAKLAAKADLIIAASPMIAERFAPERTRVLEHGVDLSRFVLPAVRAADMPSDKPVAGFYGSLNSWIDIDALAGAANTLPHWNFVLIGKHECDVSLLRKFPNVHLLGPRPHADLPSYVQHWDVSLLPFRRNRQIDASNPLKLREYLAAGMPVLASYEFPATKPYGRALTFPRAGETMADAIVRAGAEKASSSVRRKLVENEDWEVRAATLKNWLEDLG